MAFNNGTFNRLYDWTDDRDNGVNISATRFDAEMDGMAVGLSTCMLKDGTSTPTANLPMGGFLLTGLANGTANNHSVTYAQLSTLTGVANGSVTTALLANGSVTSDKLAADSVNATAIAAGAVNTSELADYGVTTGKMANGSANSLLGYNGTGVAGVVTVGSGLSLSGGTVSATGTANVTGTAGEAITINSTNNVAVVYQDIFNQRSGGADRWYMVDADATGPVKISPRVGIVTANISNGGTGSIYIAPTLVTGLASLTAGSRVWAHSGTAGAITQTKPATPSNGTQVAVVPIGNAYNATALQFQPPGPGSIVIALNNAALTNNSTAIVEHFTDDDYPTRRPLATIVGGGNVAISNGTGTNIAVGYTGGGGGNAAFDSNESQNAAAAATASSGWSGYTNYVGKDYGANTTKAVTRFRARAASDNGFVNSIAANWAFQGSADNSSFANITTGSSTGAVNETLDISNFSNTSRAFRLVFEGNGVNGGSIAELTFYENTTPRAEPVTIQSNSTYDSGKFFSVRYDSGDSANQTTKTHFTNKTGGTVNATVGVVL